MIFKLKKPVSNNGVPVESVELREPTIGDVMQANKHLTEWNEQNLALFGRELLAKITGLPVKVIGQLAAPDFNKMTKFLKQFQITEDDENIVVDGDFYSVELNPTIEALGKEISEVVVRWPTIDQIIEAEAVMATGRNAETLTRRNFKLMTLATGIEKPLLEKLPLTKYREAEKALYFFTSDAPETTEN